MEIGQQIPQILLPQLDGAQFDNRSLVGKKYLLTFFRFATCPFCNIRMAALARVLPQLGKDFAIVGIFQSELAHLQKNASDHFKDIVVLADPGRRYYDKFGVKRSFWGMLKGMIFRIPLLVAAMFRGFFPHEISSRYLIMPLSLLVDEQGVIQQVYQGRDEGDHIPIERVLAFAGVRDQPA